MHFTSMLASTIVSLGLASLAAADRLTLDYNCGLTHCHHDTWYETDFDSFSVDYYGGCGRPNIPYMQELCIDEGKQRAHFRFEGQGRRCMKLEEHQDGGCDGWNTCATNIYTETPCTWS
ncbi:hypothetical protein BU25DRAFT_109986 [Macroventuria anomochaeta]|uniref:Uncharacterized protein n=1 Tax=Macroventuria anomochaeta TaxID=301207 RepID=A0ACB6RXW9_9PLEO|nr:uncharacterized protein BU25DRAFT_109986 [Macroventuria anomochaeta]KAF2625732.1 hypothetical protein BU25DRAFT_109986 [Macroventuria anomochaeta]